MEIKYIGKCLVLEENKKKILVAGDLHLGYENSLSAGGVFVKRFLLEETLKDFNQIFNKIGNVDEVVLLGDIKHNFGQILKQEWEDAERIIEYLNERTRKVVFIKGNHDTMTAGMGKRLGFEVADSYSIGSSLFAHGDRDLPEMWKDEIETVVIGHLHPAVEISDKTKTEKYKCFLSGKYKKKLFIILPSFTEMSKGIDPRVYSNLPWKMDFDKFNVNIVGEDLEVYNFGLLKKVSN